MVRRRTSPIEDVLDLLTMCPWYVSVIVSGAIYAFLKYYLPTVEPEKMIYRTLSQLITPWAGVIAILFLIPAPISALRSYRRKTLLKSQKNIDTIRDLHWRDFEFLVAQAYRQQGYRVVENKEMGPDDGIDLVIEKNSNRYIVQCKQWHMVKVGVKVVREMFGTMHSVNAQGVIIITSGLFTQEAKNFANDKPIDLVEGNELAELIKNAQNTRPIETPPVRPPVERKTPNMMSDTKCPSCGSQLIVRVAKRGKNAGKEFIGCSSFPKCKFTKPNGGSSYGQSQRN